MSSKLEAGFVATTNDSNSKGNKLERADERVHCLSAFLSALGFLAGLTSLETRKVNRDLL